jgi:DNA invertase Pin-like site-specific DNA recombinase
MMKGWQIGEFFVERGVSGSVSLAERPEGRRMLETVSAGDVIVTSRLDRAFRSAADALGTLEELKAEGVALHMIDLGGDLCGNGISKLVFTILSAVAENERDRIRERIRDVKRHLASQGVYGGGKRPFGWNVVDGKLALTRFREELRVRHGLHEGDTEHFEPISRQIGRRDERTTHTLAGVKELDRLLVNLVMRKLGD